MSRFGELVFVWMLTRAKGKGARSDVPRTLNPFVEHR